MDKNTAQEKLPALIIGAIGVVYGDIGTSPLYALKSCLAIAGKGADKDAIMGIISLFIWSLFLIVSLKYVRFVLRMDHNGEGGVLTLASLASAVCQKQMNRLVVILGILGTALFFGDGIITPAISVLSAVEGITLINSQMTPYVVPITLGVLTILFGIQKYGSGKIGQFFGPIMILWFSVLFLLGLYNLLLAPEILKAVNPYFALNFITSSPAIGLSVMGGVVLVVTGAEALYADLGHFGRRSIQLSWVYFVFPALVANYLGQGALLLHSAEAMSNPFYLMVPSWGLQAVIGLATVATVIASQSIISGLFSIAWQAILLNYLPRMKITNTSAKNIGQVYIAAINGLIYILTMGAVLKFGSSESLAAAYGLCVAGIMMITTLLITIIAKKQWSWHWSKIAIIFTPLFLLDSIFVGSTLIKFFEGGWYTLAITALVYYIIHTWIKGSNALIGQKMIINKSAKRYIEDHLKSHPQRLPGTAMFLSREPFKIPSSLVMQLHHNKYLHSRIILASIIIQNIPYQKANERFTFQPITDECAQITAYFGFKEIPDLNKAINWLKDQHILHSNEDVSIFLGRGIPVPSRSKFLSGFSEKVYIALASLAQNATDFYKIPHHKVIELGVRYRI